MTEFLTYIYYYPIFMTLFWIAGAVVFFLRREMGEPGRENPPVLDRYPMVSVLVPCYNEEDTVADTMSALDRVTYGNYEVIAVNDGSSDNTEQELERLSAEFSWLRIIHLKNNAGKATCLNIALLASKSEFVVCLDADAMIAPNAITWMVSHFLKSPKVGAVTGNPRIRNRSSLLGRIQVGEFSAIVGMIKRCQRVTIGKVFTISGVLAGFRKSALEHVGMWDGDMITEDIDISWKLQRNSWDIHFEPRALCLTLMPETLKGLWKQRLRWAEGGIEVIVKNMGMMLSFWKQPGMSILFLDYIASIAWVYGLMAAFVLWLLESLSAFMADIAVAGNGLTEGGKVLIVLVCLVQFGVGILLDSRYEKSSGRYYYWTIWYPLVYWIISASTTIVGIPKAIMGTKDKFATWDSPDRGYEVRRSDDSGNGGHDIGHNIKKCCKII